MNLSTITNLHSQRYISFYGIIIHKTLYKSSVILSIVTPNYGIIRASLRPNPKKSGIPPIHYQQLNLVEGILKKPYSSGYYTIQELTLNHNFAQSMDPKNQWVLIGMFNSMFNYFHIYQNQEHYKLFMLTLRLLETINLNKDQSISEMLCLSAFMKALLITKVDSSVIHCFKCKGTILKNQEEYSLDQKESHFYLDVESKRFICDSCKKKYPIKEEKLNKKEKELLSLMIFGTLDQLVEKLPLYNDSFFVIIKIFNYTIYNIFHIHWDKIINKLNNPF